MYKRTINLPENQSFFLFGARQTGKSTLIQDKYKEAWFVNLLHSDVYQNYLKTPEQFRREASDKIEKQGLSRIVIDEIQRLPELLNEIHALMEKYPSCKFVMTGSSARKLRKGGVNLLGGRAVERRLYPMTHVEMGDDFALEAALRFGTLAGSAGLTDPEKQGQLSAYVNTYLREEIQSEGLSRNLAGFSRFLDVAGAQSGEIVNFTAMGRDCGLSCNSVKAYYSILEDTLVGTRLDPYIKSVRKRMTAHPKYYLFDCGVTNAVQKRLTAGLDPVRRGRLFEQFIVLETVRMASYSQSEAELFYWRTSNGAEVDLLIVKHGEIRAALEIKSSPRIESPDCSSLRAFAQEHPDTPLFIIGTVENAFSIGNVTVWPWQRFFQELPGLI